MDLPWWRKRFRLRSTLLKAVFSSLLKQSQVRRPVCFLGSVSNGAAAPRMTLRRGPIRTAFGTDPRQGRAILK
jgi:hypothetical protein